MTKAIYALIEDNIDVAGTTYDNVVVQMESPMREGLVEVPEYVRANMVRKDDGSFDYPQSIKDIVQADADKITAKATAQASGNTKLLGLGLTQAEATALTGFTPE